MLRTTITAKPLLLLREAFTSLLPVVLVMNILALLSGLLGLLDSWGVLKTAMSHGAAVNRLYFFLIPLFLNLSLSTLLAKEKELDQIGAILISMVCFFRVSGFLGVTASFELVSYHGSILTSVPCTWLSVELLAYFAGMRRWRLARQQTGLSPRIQKTLNLIIPGLLTVVCFEIAGEGVNALSQTNGLAALIQALPPLGQIGALPELIVYKTVALFTWFVGLHGEHSADGLFRLLYDIPVGETYSIRLKCFHDVFMNIGGSGSTFAIPLMLLLSKQAQPFRAIARLSLPFSLFNVNELLLFGLPILLNPVFLIPFLIAPFINMLIALLAISLGGFTISAVPMHWMSPPIYSAYVASGGSVWAVVTQLLCIGVDGCLYLPFLAIASRQYQGPLHLQNLLGEDAYGFVNDALTQRQERHFMTQQRDMLVSMKETQRVLKQLKGGRFLLYFQPKVDAVSLQLVGVEALLRFQNVAGEVLPPTFLPVLYQQGLSKVVDKKVVDMAFKQIFEWRSLGLAVPTVALNFDKTFLLDPKLVGAFMARAERCNILFDIEITEHTYTAEVETLAAVVREIRRAGHRVSIDDFGAGYSSLTTLVTLEADEIKLDRKLVIAHEQDAASGEILLASSVRLCHDLGYQLVAEGVETEAQANLVRRCGADTIQGYYFGRPMHPSQISELFSPTYPTDHTRYLQRHAS